ncbi:PIG-L family deacetylase, partial [Escherichia coli]|uniref:PIG-L family deacetylase n=1 Tax=Escherichia coli TaxID=562 RepID=UPI0021587695
MSTPSRRPGSRQLSAVRLGSAALLVTGLAAVPVPASAQAPAAAPSAVAARVPAHTGPADLDVLYVGAHPDDEAFGLSTLGEWRERYGARTGVVTVTRGEGGGNAVGPEEGPALGLIREREERA